MESYYILCLLAFFVILLLKTIKNKTTKNLPPGPSFFSGITTIFSPAILSKLQTQPHKALAELATVHGPLMTLKVGPVTSVVVSSSTLAKQILLRSEPDHFSTPYILDAVYAHQHHQYSVAWLPSSSPQWRALRRIYGGQVMSARRLDASGAMRRSKVQNLLDSLRQSSVQGLVVDIGHVALMTFFEIMLGTNFSRDLEGHKAEEIKEVLLGIIKETGKLNVVDWFPMLHLVDPQGIRRRLTALCKNLFRIFDEIIDLRLKMKTSSSNSGDDDVLDLLLDLMKSQKDGIDRNFVLHMLLDLFGAGMDTTAKTVEWAMSELINHPDTLKKAQAELDNVIGKCKIVQESDLTKLPYLQAVLKETLRLHPPAPILLPRKIEEDVEVSKFTIPAGSRMIVNVWAIGRDPDKWTNSDAFSPERFSDANIDLKGQHFDLIPFGAGRRICPGIPLALRAVPMIIASLVSCFDWKLENAKEVNMQDEILITMKKVEALRVIPICRQ